LHFYPPNQTAQNFQAVPRSTPSNQPYRHPNSSSQPFQPSPSQSQDIIRLEKQIIDINDKMENVMNLILNNSNNEKGKLPSQPEVNPKYNSRKVHFCEDENINSVNAVTTLRSGKKVDNQVGNPDILPRSTHAQHSKNHSTPTLVDPIDPSSSSKVGNPNHFSSLNIGSPNIPASIALLPSPPNPTSSSLNDKTNERVYKPKAPFPRRLESKKKPTNFDKIRENFKQVYVNVPLLDVIEQIPQYAKCLKELCTRKRATNVPKIAFLTANTCSILSNLAPIKYKDPGCPTIGCRIGNTHISHALLDLGASVNLLPYPVYYQLGLGELKPTNITIQLADRSVKKPLGIIEDVLI